MNYFISADKLGTDTQAILKNCTMRKVNNRLKVMQKAFEFHKIKIVTIRTFTNVYDECTYKTIKTINVQAHNK